MSGASLLQLMLRVKILRQSLRLNTLYAYSLQMQHDPEDSISRSLQGRIVVVGEQMLPKLEDKLQRKLHIAVLNVTVWRHTFDRPYETVSDILCTWCDVKVRMVERIKHLTAQLQ